MVRRTPFVALLLCAVIAPASGNALLNGGSAVQEKSARGSAVADAEFSANPIRRVVNLLQGMVKKVEAEGKKEEELYEKFQCYCKNGGADLSASISSSTAKVPQVQSDIEETESKVKGLQQDLKSHQEDRTAAKAAMAAATSQREEEHKKFLAVSGEYKGYVDALSGAIPAIEKGMAGGFLQAKAGAQLRQAVASSTAMTDYDRQLVLSYLSGSTASSDEYIPKSGEITGILKSLLDDFEKNLADVTAEEESAVKLYEELMAAKTKQVTALTESIEKKTVLVGELQVEIVNMKNDLTETEAALIADQKFLATMDEACAKKAKEYEERTKTRSEELVAIHETIKILNDDDALELFKKTLPSASLLQVRTAGNLAKRRSEALSWVRKAQQKAPKVPQLDFMAVALSGKKVDFSKVIKMIDDMVALLKTEQLDDANKKEYCELQLDAADDKAKDLAKKVEDLEASISEAEEAISTLAGELKELVKGIEKLDKSVAEATEQRKEEHEEFTELITSDSAAKELLGYAKNRLNKFYNPKLYKAPPKRKLTEEEKMYTSMGGELEPTAAPGGIAGTGVEIPSFVEIARHSQLAHGRDDPGPAPDTWGAYSKKSEETTGVIGMIDLLVRDLDKEMTEAEVEEKDSQKEYEEAMNDAAAKRAADLKAMAEKEKAKADAEETKTSDTSSKKAEEKELMATKMYEMDLHQDCDWLLQNFELRKDARSDEMESLKTAKSVLSGADFSFVQGQPPRGNLRGN